MGVPHPEYERIFHPASLHSCNSCFNGISLSPMSRCVVLHRVGEGMVIANRGDTLVIACNMRIRSDCGTCSMIPKEVHMSNPVGGLKASPSSKWRLPLSEGTG